MLVLTGFSLAPANKENDFFLLGRPTDEPVRANTGSDWFLCGSSKLEKWRETNNQKKPKHAPQKLIKTIGKHKKTKTKDLAKHIGMGRFVQMLMPVDWPGIPCVFCFFVSKVFAGCCGACVGFVFWFSHWSLL